MPLATRYLGSSFTFDSVDDLPSSSSGAIRAFVTDGMNTTSAAVGDLLLTPNRAPEVHIVTPVTGDQSNPQVNVVLQGSAYDLEDGQLGPPALAWYSNRDGFIGPGPVINTDDLSIGTNVITLKAIDSQGAQGSDAITFVIQVTP